MPGDGDVAFLGRLVRNLKARGPDPLRPMIDAYLLERGRSEDRLSDYVIDMRPRRRPAGRLTPSGLGGCSRKAVFTFLGTRPRKAVDLDLELIFEDGNWRHHKWQALFHDMEIVLGKDRFEVVSIEDKGVDPELYLMGYSDAIIRINGVLYVVDFKGINDRGYTYVFSDDEAKPAHVIQVTGYEHLFKVDKGILLYDNKNNQRTRSIAVPWSDENWADTRGWAEGVLGHLDDRKLPARHPECNAGSLEYESKCPFTYLCFPRDHEDADRLVLQRKAYKGFRGLRAAWRAGNRELRSGG